MTSSLEYSEKLKNATESAFEKYISDFDREDERIKLKITHTYHVADNCLALAKELKQDAHDTALSYLLGMLHDIGRFEQTVKYNTFLDDKCDHAEEGADYLVQGGHLRDFLPEGTSPSEEDVNIIEKAIRFHNKHVLPDYLNGREKLFCNIIRDADKVDIFRAVTAQPFRIGHEYDEKTVAKSHPEKEVRRAFKEHDTVDFKLRETPADIFLSHIALSFGLVYSSSKKLLYEQGFLHKMMDFKFDDYETEREYEQMCDEVNRFLLEK